MKEQGNAMEQSEGKRMGLIIALLVVIGLMAGAVVGLLVGWVFWPVKFVDTTIADLAPEHKEEYVLLVAYTYALDGDLDKAVARLELLDVPNINQWLSALIDTYILEGRDVNDIRALVTLADALGVSSPQMVAYLASPTPMPTDTPPPTPTPAPTDTPTITPIPPTATAVPPTDTPQPEATATALPSDTPVPPTDTPIPPTATSLPPTATRVRPTATPAPPTNTPSPPAPKWSWHAWLVGVGQDNQTCESGNLQVRVMVLDANGSQIPGVWFHDLYSKQYQLTGNVDSPDYGPGETKFEYGVGGGGKLCVATGEGGSCVTDYSRDMSCYNAPPFEDLWGAGYCECCEVGISKERCQELYNTGAQCMKQPRHYSWRIEYKRGW